MKEPIDFEIKGELEATHQAVAERLRLNYKKAKGSPEEKKEAEYRIHLTSRKLFSAFHNTETWGGANTKTVRAVGVALRKAVKCVTNDRDCKKSVKNRLEHFRDLIRLRRLRKTD